MIERQNSVVATIVVICLAGFSAGRGIQKQSPSATGQLSFASEEPLFPIWDERGKEGFINAQGRIVIAPTFDRVMPFQEGLAGVEKDGKWGYVDRTGKVVIPLQWSSAESFSDGVAAVVDHYHIYGKPDGDDITLAACGFIDKTGRYLIEPSIERRLEQCPTFSEGLARVCFAPGIRYYFRDFPYDGQCGYLDKSGQWAIKPQYLVTPRIGPPGDFSEGLAPVALKEIKKFGDASWQTNFAYIDRNGRSMFEAKGYFLAYPFREGMAQLIKWRTYGEEKPGTATVDFIDRTGRVLFKFEGVDIYDVDRFYEGRALVKDPQTKLYGYIDKSGNWVIPPKYAFALRFSDGWASVCVREQTQCAYIDRQGEVMLKMDQWGWEFHGGLARQYLFTRTIGETPTNRNIEGYMNRSGKYVWVSPGGEYIFKPDWWRENYVGPQR